MDLLLERALQTVTFPKQLVLFRSITAALAAAMLASAIVGFVSLATGAVSSWGVTAGRTALSIILGVVLARFVWRVLSPQRKIARLCQNLREIASALPDRQRWIFTHHRAGVAVVVLPAAHPLGSDSFCCFDLSSLEDVSQARVDDLTHLMSTEFRVVRAFPYSVRLTHADSVRRTDKEFRVATCEPSSVRGDARALLLNYRTGVMTPSHDELTHLVHVLRTAERNWPLPESPGDGRD